MKLIIDDNGSIIEVPDDEEKEIIDVENDPYWQAPIPKSERKHHRPEDYFWIRKLVAVLASVLFLYSLITLVFVLLGAE